MILKILYIMLCFAVAVASAASLVYLIYLYFVGARKDDSSESERKR